jgi:hypothetical protein
LLGSKTLRWTEIARVSGRGYGIKLHNFDEDVTVAPMYRLPGYEEVIEWIGRKRPDLFGAQEFSEMKRGYLQLLRLFDRNCGGVRNLWRFFFSSTDPGALTSTDVIVPLIFLVVIIFSLAGSFFSLRNH